MSSNITKSIKVSCDEIKVTCYKAYFALYRKNGEAHKVANIVVNNEIIGLKGVNYFAKTLNYLKNCDDLTIDLATTNNKVVADLKNCSVIESITILLDYILNILSNNSSATLIITNTNSPWFCIGALMDLAKNNNINIVAKWSDTNNHNTVVCNFQSGSIYPNIYADNYAKKPQPLTILFNKNKTAHNTLPLIYSEEKLKKTQQQNIKQGIGINIEDFKIIQKFASAILVEETKESYKDAGE